MTDQIDLTGSDPSPPFPPVNHEHLHSHIDLIIADVALVKSASSSSSRSRAAARFRVIVLGAHRSRRQLGMFMRWCDCCSWSSSRRTLGTFVIRQTSGLSTLILGGGRLSKLRAAPVVVGELVLIFDQLQVDEILLSVRDDCLAAHEEVLAAA